MFCMNCGAAVSGDAVAACANCGKLQQPALLTPDVGRAIKEASADALAAVRQVAVDPIGGLASSFSMLGERRGYAAGLAFGVAFALQAAVASIIAASRFQTTSTLKLFFGTFLMALVPFAAFVAASALVRKVAGGTGTLGADVFVAGVALQPCGLFFLGAAILGIANYQAIALLGLFASTYVMCILFAGCTRVAGIAERLAPPVISVMLLAALWLSKIVITAFLGDASPLGRWFQ